MVNIFSYIDFKIYADSYQRILTSSFRLHFLFQVQKNNITYSSNLNINSVKCYGLRNSPLTELKNAIK